MLNRVLALGVYYLCGEVCILARTGHAFSECVCVCSYLCVHVRFGGAKDMNKYKRCHDSERGCFAATTQISSGPFVRGPPPGTMN